jgi:hypothetical protein
MSNNDDYDASNEGFEHEDDLHVFADEQSNDDFANFDPKRYGNRRRPIADDDPNLRRGQDTDDSAIGSDFANFDPAQYISKRRTSTYRAVGGEDDETVSRSPRGGRSGAGSYRSQLANQLNRETNPLRLLLEDANPLIRYGVLLGGCAAITLGVVLCGGMCLLLLTLVRR